MASGRNSELLNNPFGVTQNFKGNNCDEIEMWFFYKYYNLAVTRFEWLNLPNEIEPFFIEDVMFWRGKGLMLKDSIATENPYAFMRCNLTGLMDIYNIPEDRYAFANTGYFKEYGKDDSVILWDTPLTMPKFYSARIYAKTMANLWNTRDINIFAQRTPVIVAMTEDNKLSYENVILKYQQYLPVIKVDDYMNLEKIKTLKTEAPYLVDKLQLEMDSLESEFLTELGIESNPIEKKERLISDEVGGNNGKTEMYRNTSLSTRKRFCKQVNALWGLNIDVEFRSQFKSQVNGGVEDDFMVSRNDGNVSTGENNDED